MCTHTESVSTGERVELYPVHEEKNIRDKGLKKEETKTSMRDRNARTVIVIRGTHSTKISKQSLMQASVHVHCLRSPLQLTVLH